jgi:hypothetical protein
MGQRDEFAASLLIVRQAAREYIDSSKQQLRTEAKTGKSGKKKKDRRHLKVALPSDLNTWG